MIFQDLILLSVHVHVQYLQDIPIFHHHRQGRAVTADETMTSFVHGAPLTSHQIAAPPLLPSWGAVLGQPGSFVVVSQNEPHCGKQWVNDCILTSANAQ